MMAGGSKVKMLDLNYYTVEAGPRGAGTSKNLAQKTFQETHGARTNYNGSVM